MKIQVKLTVKPPEERDVHIFTAIVFTKGHAVVSPWKASAAELLQSPEGTVFDLANLSWFDAANCQWIDLEACRDWERGSWKLTELNLHYAPDELQPFFRALVEPDFVVTEQDDGRLLLQNPRLRLEVTPGPPVSREVLSQFYAYDRINAYHKSMTEEKLPPTQQLAIAAELEKRSIMPEVIAVVAWSPQGDVTLTSRTVIGEPSLNELEWAAAAVGKAYAS